MTHYFEFNEFLKYISDKLEKINLEHPQIQHEDLLFILVSTLSDKYQIKRPLEFYSQILKKKDIDQVLDNYNYKQIKNKFILNITLPDNILLPEEKVKIKSNGQIWYIHKNDQDPFPSQPHAHFADCNLKVDLSNGKCYQIKKHLKTLSKKDLILLRKNAEEKGIKLPKLQK